MHPQRLHYSSHSHRPRGAGARWRARLSAAAHGALALAVVASPGAVAQDVTMESKSDDADGVWIAGAGYIRGANPFVAEPDGVSTAIPLVGYFGQRLTWLGPFLSYEVGDLEDGVKTNLISSLRFQGFEYDGDDPRLAGVSDRDTALDAGVSVTSNGLKLALLGDVSGTYGGYEVALSYGKDFRPNRRTSIDLSANLTWQSSQLVDYYYGVDADEASAIRPAYTGSAGTNVGVVANLRFFLTRKWMFMSRASVTRLADDIIDSPIVQDDYESSLMAGLVYRFGIEQ